MILLKFGDLKGDSTVEGKDGWITLSSFAIGTRRELQETSKTGSSEINLGLADLGPVSVSKGLDPSSAKMFLQSISGASVPTAEIEFSTMGEQKPLTYLSYKLDRPAVLSWDLAADEDDRPTEELTIWYQKILMTSFAFDASGNEVGKDSVGWDRIKNTTWSG